MSKIIEDNKILPKYKKDANAFIRIAKETQVLGENPIKYWDRTKFRAHLDSKKTEVEKWRSRDRIGMRLVQE